ncbi:Ferric reductase and cupric reductase, reduces siderophore-bound iron and oxidized copper prior to u [Komagataella phaffii GS115]|uniref:Ferric reductase and cupric reductase, reduces siderophore-bound iron and oxidized copper prior to u n=1 Tax=Komagataella phaffii (strain GS115 / ATCC 20864) TaxID=644223 RepID=C4QZH4_KOMPG|nr:Ferric reductase and cupric reductase, reduces siderophore-bound iron and oxidized copper prior to u [Komagataella phaffii GS115]AOA62086.1 GQ67_00072T0 [Komagataella phaffii]AOA68140.1 GQ68_01315T0 [Komagataella phaffii GS115]CAH2448857.1 Ferric reductase [Komagataella phaffii CBS 7435]CAY68648.1 Ferric reductase and cupric reductase, reduces siderophore-bound iron and oxidized copper prior to u [Komagataella phaffii GS115]
MLITSLLVLILFNVLATAKIFAKPSSLMFSCLTASQEFQYDFVPPPDVIPFWYIACNYEPALGSIVFCMDSNADSICPFSNSLEVLALGCQTQGDRTLTQTYLMESGKNATKYMKNPASDPDFNFTQLTTPIMFNMSEVVNKKDAYYNFFDNLDDSTKFGDFTIIYWGVLLILIGLFNHISAHNYLKSISLNSRLNQWKALVVLPTLSSYHLNPARFRGIAFFEALLPLRQETFVLIAYILLCVYYTTSNYKVIANSPLFGSPYRQYLRFISDRTGIFAFTQLPLLILFGGRNNILMTISGLPFNTFIIFHKWISRVMMLCAVVHAHQFVIYLEATGTFRRSLGELYFQFGELALLCCLLIMVQSVFYFRKRCYELFLVLHIFLAFIFLVGCYFHVSKIGYSEWILATLGLWILDRVWRFVNIYRYGVQTAQLTVFHPHSTDSNREDPTVKVSIPKPATWKSYPGCFVYLYFLDPHLKFWESHPFTIYDSTDQFGDPTPMINIYIKPKCGTTKAIYDQIMSRDITGVKVLVEGPYGHRAHTENYDQLLLFVGGNGIPGPFSHAARSVSALPYKDVESFKKVELVWSIKTLSALNWFYDELIQLKDTNVSVTVYVTRGDLSLADDDNSSTSSNNNIEPEILTETSHLLKDDTNNKSKKREVSSIITIAEKFHNLSKFVTFIRGRPNFEKKLDQVINECSQASKITTIGLVACGPSLMCDNIRNLVAHRLSRNDTGKFRIDLLEELQVW